MGTPTADEAREALAMIDRSKKLVEAEIGLPRVYWWVMAVGWILLGVVGDLGNSFATTAVTVAFGAAHSAVASRLLDGRRRTRDVRVSADIAGRTTVLVIGTLLAAVALTVGLALALQADGDAHPTTWAAVVIAMILCFGGPEILRTLRRLFHA
jgi:hypothetical protein